MGERGGGRRRSRNARHGGDRIEIDSRQRNREQRLRGESDSESAPVACCVAFACRLLAALLALSVPSTCIVACSLFTLTYAGKRRTCYRLPYGTYDHR
jgi:hypothetical protein